MFLYGSILRRLTVEHTPPFCRRHKCQSRLLDEFTGDGSSSVYELSSALRLIPPDFLVERINASADPVASFKYKNLLACFREFTRSHEPRSSCSNDDDVKIHRGIVPHVLLFWINCYTRPYIPRWRNGSAAPC